MPDIYLMITIDTEEDNWDRARTDITLENIDHLWSVQAIFDRYGLLPIYLCTITVMEDKHSRDMLNEIYVQNRCDIGTHLHPWNCPPMDEPFNEFNSHLKNLPLNLIEAKITYITEKLHDAFGFEPRIFRAGRWGADKKVLGILPRLGYEIDTSVSPFMNWFNYGSGMDFTDYPFKPFFINNLVELPVTIGYNRALFSHASKFQKIITSKILSYTKINGFLCYFNLLKKIWLSPELSNASEMMMLTKMMLANDCNFLNFTFHSSSLKPGLSPFIKTSRDSEVFLKNCDAYFEWLFSHYNVISVTSKNILPYIENSEIKLSSEQLTV